MRFLPDERLYLRTEACLRFLREVGTGPGGVAPGSSVERFHLYWHGPFAQRQRGGRVEAREARAPPIPDPLILAERK